MSRTEYIEKLLKAVVETERQEQEQKAIELFEYLQKVGYIKK